MEQRTTGNDSLINRSDLYQKMIEEIQDYAIILLDKDGIVRNWNKGAQKIKQYTEQDIIGRHFSIFYLQEDLDSGLPQKLIKQAEVAGRAAHEGWRKRKDGTRFWGSITITAIHDEDGSVIGFTKVTRDLTDKKVAEDRLRMSEERYHNMIAEVQDYAIILLSPEGIIQNWNAGAENIKGYTAAEIVGKSFEVFYPEEARNSGMPGRLLHEAKTKGKATQEGWRVRKDGSRFWGTIVITAVHGKDGSVIGFSKVTRDLTQQKVANDKLAAYTAELELQNSELEQFAYVASHDLQEPLRKIQTFAELILENYGDEPFVRTYFKKLDAAAKRMSVLIKSLLEYSRLSKLNSNATDDPRHTEVDLNSTLGDAQQDFELLMEEKSAVINSGILPVVTGHPVQLSQLFSNLISNSLKFCNQAPVIAVTACIVAKKEIPDAPDSLADVPYHQIVFQDNGIGFEEQYSKLIFSLFQRLHSRQDYAGTGIGLALCKKITENHNGYIRATGRPGIGTAFYIYLPVSVGK